MSFLLTIFPTPNTRCLFQYHFHSPTPTGCHTNSVPTLTVGLSVRLHSLKVPFHKTAFQMPSLSHCYLADDHRSLDSFTELRDGLCFPSFYHCVIKDPTWEQSNGREQGHKASTPFSGMLCDSALEMCLECYRDHFTLKCIKIFTCCSFPLGLPTSEQNSQG